MLRHYELILMKLEFLACVANVVPRSSVDLRPREGSSNSVEKHDETNGSA
jgi:hypothetical protein